jgi:FkbM family methyltransferase
MKIVYDFGANNGSNIPYYLLRFDKIVAVEANPELADYISKEYSRYIKEGRLFVENCVVSNKNDIINFYIHKHNHVLSQMIKPDKIDDFDVINIVSVKPSEIIKKYGDPEYVKIDLEHSDAEILSEMFNSGIFPNYISAEAHDVRVFSLLTSYEMYRLYKVLDGKSISRTYNNFYIYGERYSFPFHSAGPMFEDIASPALNREQLFYFLAQEGLGWKDIHAKRSY